MSSPVASAAAAAAATPAAAAAPSGDALTALAEGAIFALYRAQAEGKVDKTDIFLFYRAAGTLVGSIYMADAKEGLATVRAAAASLPADQLQHLPSVAVRDISTVALDKASLELKSAAAATAPAECCFTLGTATLSLHLQADTQQTRDTWANGITGLVAQAATEAKTTPAAANSAPAPAPGRRFSFETKDPTLAETLPATAADTMVRLAANDMAVLQIPALDFVSMMLVGRAFGFHADVEGKATRFPVFLFYKFEQGTPGFLFWCQPGTRVENANTMLTLSSVDRLYVGKQVAVFTPEAKDECCFTLLTPNAMVNLEAGSASQASAWIFAIDAALRGYSGKRFYQVEDPKLQRYRIGSLNEPPKDETPAAAAAAAPAQPAAAAASAAAAAPAANPDIAETLQILQAGRVFKRHTASSVDKVMVLYKKDETKAGSLYFGPADGSTGDSNSTGRIPLQTIADLFVGKQVPEFQTSAAASADALQCLAIKYRSGPQSFSFLCVEGDTPAVIDYWVRGIFNIVTSSGKKVIVSAGDEAPAPVQQADVRAAAEAAPAPFVVGTEADLQLPIDVIVGMMNTGRIFTKYDRDAKEAVLFFYLKDETKSGSFYWCDPKTQHETSPDRRLPLHALTDIYLGKQDPVFQLASSSGAVDEHCVTFVDENKKSVNLEAESKDVLAAWLAGVDLLIKQGGKDVLLESADADAERSPLPSEDGDSVSPLPAAGAAAPPPSARSASRRFSIKASESKAPLVASATLPESESLALVSSGRLFTKYDTTGIDKVFVFYARDATRSGSLYWCAPEQREQNAANSVALHLVTDIFYGKQTAGFNTSEAAGANEDRCVSVVSRDGRTLNLEARSEEQLSAWLQGIQVILAQGGKKILMGEDEKAAAASSGRRKRTRRFSVQQGKSAPMADRPEKLAAEGKERAVGLGRGRKAAVLALPGEAKAVDAKDDKQPAPTPVADMEAGKKFRRFDAASGKAVEGVLVWYAPASASAAAGAKIGSLAFSDDGAKPVASTAQSFQLAGLADVVTGTEKYPFMTAAGAADNKSVTLVFPDGSLHIEAAEKDDMQSWLFGLHAILTDAGNVVVTEEADAKRPPRRFSVVNAVAFDNEQKASPLTPDAAVKLISGGEIFTGLIVRKGVQRAQKLRVFYVNPQATGYGRLYWCSANEKTPVQNDALSVSLAEINDIVAGKGTPAFQGPMSDQFAEGACLTIFSPTRTLTLASDSVATADAYIMALKHLIAQARAQEKENEPKAAPAAERAGAGSAAGGPAVGIDAIRKAIEGSDFTAYRVKAGRLNSVRIFMFYVPPAVGAPANDYGRLYWCAPGAKDRNDKYSVLLNNIHDLFIGKHKGTAFENAGPQIADDRVFTIDGPGHCLGLEAPTREIAAEWLSAITTILNRSGRDFLVQDEEGKVISQTQGQNPQAGGVVNAVEAAAAAANQPRRLSRSAQPEYDAAAPALAVPLEDALALFAEGKASHAAPNGHELEKFATTGRRMTAYLGTDQVIVAPLLFHFTHAAPGDRLHAPGRLYWSAPSKKDEREANSIGLSAIVDFTLGKKSGPLLSPEAAKAPDNCCFALHTRAGNLCIEAPTPAMRDAWVVTIVHLMVNAGRRFVVLNDEKDREHGPIPRYEFLEAEASVALLAQPTGALARQLVTNPAALAGAAEMALRLMKEGNNFEAYMIDRNGALQSKQFCVFWKPDQKTPGTIFWNDRVSYEENPKFSLAVSQITNIYIGKQTSPFLHQDAKPLEDNTCFSIVTESRTLNFRAPNSMLLNAWLLGLRSLCTDTSSSVTLKEEDRGVGLASIAAASAPAPAAGASGAAGPAPSVTVVTRRSGVLEHVRALSLTFNAAAIEKVLQFISFGSTFWRFHSPAENSGPAGVNREVITFYYRQSSSAVLADGALYWCEDGAKQDADPRRSLPFSALLEIILHKQGAAFQVPEAREAPDVNCMTLRSINGANLYLCAQSTEDLYTWLYALVFLLPQGTTKKVRVTEDEDAASVVDPKSAEQAKIAAVFDLMKRGSRFYSYEETKDRTELRKRAIQVWLEDSALAGAPSVLCWRAATGTGLTSRVPVSSITDIYTGKRTKVLAAVQAAEESRCLALASAGNVLLNLEGDSRKLVLAWAFGLKVAGAYATAPANARVGLPLGRDVQVLSAAMLAEQGLDGGRTLQSELELEANPSAVAATRSAATDHALRALARGRAFNAYTAAGQPRVERVFVRYEAPLDARSSTGHLKWNVGESASAVAQRALALDKLSDILLGKQASAFRTPEAARVEADRCVSLLADDGRLSVHLEADSSDSARMLVLAINAAVAAVGREVVSLPSKAEGRRFAIISTPAVVANSEHRALLSQPLLAESTAQLAMGSSFVSHSATAPHTAPIHVFYKAGALYWCELGKRAESSERRIPVNKITHLAAAKHAPAFFHAHARDVSDDNVLSIWAGNVALHLEAKTSEIAQVWLIGLSALLVSIQRTVISEGEGHFAVVQDIKDAAAAAARVGVVDHGDSDFGGDFDGASLQAFDEIVAWEGYLKRGDNGRNAFFRLTTSAFSAFASPSDAKPLAVIPLGSVLRVRGDESGNAKGELSLLVACAEDDRVVRLLASSQLAAQSLASQIKRLVKHTAASARMHLEDVAGALATLFVDANASVASPSSAAAAVGDSKDEKDTPTASLPTPGSTLYLGVKNVTLFAPVKGSSEVSFVISVGGRAIEVEKSVVVDKDGLVPRQRVVFKDQTVAVLAPLFDLTGRPRNLLVDIAVYAQAPGAVGRNHGSETLLGHWTNGYINDAAEATHLPRPAAVAGFWHVLDGAAFKGEVPLFNDDGTEVGTLDLAFALRATPVDGKDNKDDKAAVSTPTNVAVAAADEDEVVLALTPEEATTMLAERPPGTISSKERAEFLRVLSVGQNFARWSVVDGKTVKDDVFVFYSAMAGPLGSLFWSAPNTRVASGNKRLPVHAITEYVLGNNAAPALKAAKNDCAISLRTEKFVLNLEASSPSHLTALICAFHALKSNSGAK